MVAPLLTQLQSSHGITIYSQDDASFPDGANVTHDSDLSFSWHNNIETVPTVIKVVDGVEVDRTVGWLQNEWSRMFNLPNIGDDLPAYRPGCGSLSVDPDNVDALRVKFEGSILTARRIEIASLEDEMEALFARGWTDGLPVVPPTPERVMRMLSGTSLAPNDVVAIAPPDLVELNVEKIAINAVMAGCLPQYLPWVIAALKAVCTDEFNMHGVLATTMPVGPVIVCSGPGTRAIG
ncbi:MAG: thioredoxin, partial [Actinobacteria bacterium]